MRQCILIVPFFLLILAPVFAEGASNADDPIAAELTKAKAAYQAAVEKAKEKLLSALDDQLKRAEANSRLKVEQKIKVIEQLAADRKAFEADESKLPESSVVKASVSIYTLSIRLAFQKCQSAFEQAAEEYGKRKDLNSAKAVLQEKETFLNTDQMRVVLQHLDTRRQWVHAKGAFRRIETGIWEENSSAGKAFRYKEVARTKEYVEIDATTGNLSVRVRLYDKRADYGFKPKLNFTTYFNGAWTK